MNKERKPQFIITSERLKGAMEAVNINASTLSQRTGVSEQSISQYVNGFHAPSNITAGKLATALNCNPLYLMGFEEHNLKESDQKEDATAAELVERIRAMDEGKKALVKQYLDLLDRINENKEK